MVKEERGTGLIPTFRFTPFGYFLSQIIHSLRSSVNVEDKLYDLLNDGLFKVQTYSPAKGESGPYISIFKKVKVYR